MITAYATQQSIEIANHSRVQQAFTIDMSSMEYIRALDKTLLHGALFKCLDHRGIPVTVKKTPPNHKTPAKTVFHNGKFIIMLSGPQTLTTNADVGARVCRSVDACNVILLQHEFVHMVEF